MPLQSDSIYPLTTLGPSGTCSDQVADRYLKSNKIAESHILRPSFEECVEDVLSRHATALLLPSAYRRYADIIFNYTGTLTVYDSFRAPTPEFFLMIKNNVSLNSIKKIASHATPQKLIEKVQLISPREVVLSSSNANSAILLEQGHVDACLTVKSSQTEAMLTSGNYIALQYFGSVMMAWSIIGLQGDEYINIFRSSAVI